MSFSPKPFRKPLFLSLFFVLVLSACTNQFAYNTLPFWIDYYLSDFVDMSREQQAQFDKDLEAFHTWHRKEELPKIQALLDQLNADIASPLSYPRITQYHQLTNERMLASLQGLTPALVTLIGSLSDKQVDQWMKAVDEKIAEGMKKANEGTQDDQIKRRQTRLIERAEKWIGKANDKQKKQLLEMASYQIEMRPVFYALRDSLVEELEQILRNRQSPDLAERINTYFAHLVAFKHDAYELDMNLYLARRYELLQRLDRQLSEKQRRELRATLSEYSNDISAVLN